MSRDLYTTYRGGLSKQVLLFGADDVALKKSRVSDWLLIAFEISCESRLC